MINYRGLSIPPTRMGVLDAIREPSQEVLDALNSSAQCEGWIPEGWADAIDAIKAGK